MSKNKRPISMFNKRKYYVVWRGHQPGIYTNWLQAKDKVIDYPWAKYKRFDSEKDALVAFSRSWRDYIKPSMKGADLDETKVGGKIEDLFDKPKDYIPY